MRRGWMQATRAGAALFLLFAGWGTAAGAVQGTGSAGGEHDPGREGWPDGTAEAALAGLSRAALRDPASAETWVALAHALARLRPEPWQDIPTQAERIAYRIADSLVAATPGAIRELRLEPREGRSEFVVVTGDPVRFFLSHRLDEPDGPRILLTLYEATPGLVEPGHVELNRGGIRGLSVTAPNGRTVRLELSLAEPLRATFVRRDGELVLRLPHPEPFVPWSTRPSWAAGEPQPWTPPPPAPQPPPAEAEQPATAEQPAPPPPWRQLGADLARRLRGMDARPIALAAAGLLATGLAGLAVRRRRNGLPPRQGRSAADDGRYWAARTLADHGAPPAEVARRTGLARDAIALLTRRSAARRHAEVSAGTGTFFRPPAGPSAGVATGQE